MIVATIITYNDIETIKACIESVKDKVDKIIVVDGKYRDFPGEDDCSTDGTVEYIASLYGECNLIFNYAERLDEVAKRNVYLTYLKEGDTCLNIDADEMVTGNIPDLDTDMGRIMIGAGTKNIRHHRTIRFFKFHEGLHYWGRHTLILDKDDKVFADLQHTGIGYTVKKIKEFELLHRNDLRSEERMADKKKYYKILMAREAKVNVPAN